MAKNEKYDAFANGIIAMATVLTLASCYYQAAPTLARYGMTVEIIDEIILIMRDFLESPLEIKILTLILMACTSVFRTGKKVEASWTRILIMSAAGTALFMLIPSNGILYTVTSLAGFGTALHGLGLIIRKMKGDDVPDEQEGFDQNQQAHETPYSFNIPYEFIRKGKKQKGVISVVNPFRASLVMGSPGSGKSFAIYNPIIEQSIRKNYTMFLYDYKFPDLTERLLTEIAYQKVHEHLWEKDMDIKPHLYIINFDNPLKSNRCNPIHHSYITDPADTSEIADLVFKNINKGADTKGFDFFNESAKVYLDALVWYLANYDPDAIYDDNNNVIGSRTDYVNKGSYCTFPHVIELMALDYKKIFKILQHTKGLEAKISPFASALEGEAMEQLSGQIASAQIPMGKFVSPALYWVMSGDDFTLDFNNPKEPKIICMGNNPDRQSIYGTTLALYTSRMFKLINHKKKLKSVVLLDELPTIFIKGLDNLIATARSNKVAIVAGIQDKSQLRRDYGERESDVIVNTVGNVFSGSVEGVTAKDISHNFGKEFRKKVSRSLGDDSDSKSISYQLEDILPASEIMDMSQGTFCGWVKDDFSETIRRKKFHGSVTIDLERNARLEREWQTVPVITKMFGDTMPAMEDKDRERLMKLWPNLAEDEKALKEKFINEKIDEIVNENFRKIKLEVKDMVDREHERIEELIARES